VAGRAESAGLLIERKYGFETCFSHFAVFSFGFCFGLVFGGF
jgi:hypothetical protein